MSSPESGFRLRFVMLSRSLVGDTSPGRRPPPPLDGDTTEDRRGVDSRCTDDSIAPGTISRVGLLLGVLYATGAVFGRASLYMAVPAGPRRGRQPAGAGRGAEGEVVGGKGFGPGPNSLLPPFLGESRERRMSPIRVPHAAPQEGPGRGGGGGGATTGAGPHPSGAHRHLLRGPPPPPPPARCEAGGGEVPPGRLSGL